MPERLPHDGQMVASLQALGLPGPKTAAATLPGTVILGERRQQGEGREEDQEARGNFLLTPTRLLSDLQVGKLGLNDIY